MSHLKNKIINDPIYGFIHIPFDIIGKLIAHPYFQRLRRISQLGLSSLVYPGATHSRFHHAIGAMYLMDQAIQTLIKKGHKITKKEHEASLIAILLHDIGHGPFSHALENSIVQNLSHETISSIFMNELNVVFNGKLSLAIDIFKKRYKKQYLSDLIAGQLDVDRLDYLNRDSFYSGVNEGIINSDRIISMLTIHENRLVVDYKGLYSIEKFIIARKLMYWQVYLHKTVLSAEHTLMNILKRAKELVKRNVEIFTTPQFHHFLYEKKDINERLFSDKNLLEKFAVLDDSDILTCIKNWCSCDDKVLKILSNTIINRQLLKIKVIDENEIKKKVDEYRKIVMKQFDLNKYEVKHLVFSISIQKETYNFVDDEIKFFKNNQTLINLSEIKQELSINSQIIKHYICFPKQYVI